VRSFSPHYPLIYRDSDWQTRVAFTKREISEESIKALDRRARQEGERLLYVATTRPKHTLILVDDADLFATKKGASEAAQLSLLKAERGGVNAETLAAVRSVPASCPETMERRREADSHRDAFSAINLPRIDQKVIDASRERARHFVKRNPSALTHEITADPTKVPDPEVLALAADPVAKHFGTWWHGLMNDLQWERMTTWQVTFESALSRAPDPGRAAIEWPLFVEKIGRRSELAAPGLVFHAEMPFLWRTSERDCIEGIADLLVFNRTLRKWLVLDWKTNHIRKSDAIALRDQYGAQLAAYRAAFRAMLGAPVSAAIYSTSTGEWMAYDDGALDRTWEEISGFPEAIEAALLS
jgi:ATP-dependent exoDNAse (exonuclease V) beta subunit